MLVAFTVLPSCSDDTNGPPGPPDDALPALCNARSPLSGAVTVCPPLYKCIVPGEPDDLAGYCIATSDNECSTDSPCDLAGYSCIDGRCVPDLCDDQSECSDGLCYFGRTGEQYPGICLEADRVCPDGPPSCQGEIGCALCTWNEWRCAVSALYPVELCM